MPDYPSTHTVLGAAAAAVLARYFGTDFVSFSMTSGAPYGITRKFWSFSEAARENGASRVLAGIHFATAVQAGYEQGERIGAFTRGALRRFSSLDGSIGLLREPAHLAQRPLVALVPDLPDGEAHAVAVALRRREHRAGRDGDAALEQPLERHRVAAFEQLDPEDARQRAA